MASSPITSWQIDGETMKTVTDFIFLGSKITADGDCSHEIKRHLLLRRKAMTNLKVKVTQSCLTLFDPMDYSVHGILQARIVEWVAFPFSKGSSQPRDWTQVSRIAGRVFTSWTTREAPCIGIWILYHWATREVPSMNTLKELVILQWSIGFR